MLWGFLKQIVEKHLVAVAGLHSGQLTAPQDVFKAKCLVGLGFRV